MNNFVITPEYAGFLLVSISGAVAQETETGLWKLLSHTSQIAPFVSPLFVLVDFQSVMIYRRKCVVKLFLLFMERNSLFCY